ncbi:type VII secretion-associated serine protease mycosin [Couchioplanes caeruleus subsp. caeruleus]|uniref:Type VII secretion-associated serine protease mycosin n=1 Tax=Couchioplanes caeruleus subsp. caeruleus TaxID=56427 RepID=A0A1K0GT11_9ACTN|nr:type VII secretion-associated serine protease mycosin [Couchioplanes caeruleus subsp. caeruleus]
MHRGRALAAVIASLALVCGTAAPAAAQPVRDRQWHLTALKVGKAHEVTRGASVTVAVIDSGIDAKHQDLAGAVLPGKDFFDPGGDGRVDVDGHGTAMTGIIAGRGHGEDRGILGIAPAAKILPVRVPLNMPSGGKVLADAITYAAGHGARVINMSLGSNDEALIHEAIRAAQAADIVLVASSGNRGEIEGDYPAKYPEVLAVGAVDRAGKIAKFSITGPQVDIAAPGVDIASTDIGETGYSVSYGTSHATAVVSGAAALIRARYPELSAADVVHRLTATAVDAGKPGRDDVYGHGRLDLVKALTADVPAAPPTATPSASVRPGPVEVPSASAGSRRVSPILLTSGLAAVVLILGGAVVALMLRRR